MCRSQFQVFNCSEIFMLLIFPKLLLSGPNLVGLCPQALEDHYNHLETELREEIKKLTKSQTQFDEMQSTIDSCDSMIMALKNEEERKRCPLESMKLAVKEADAEGIEVPDGLVYIGGGKFLEKKQVAKAEHETSFKTRMSALLQLILGSDLGAYGLSTSNDKIAIQQYQLDSLYALLNTMKWTKKCPLPQNFNKDYVRRQAGKICSEASAGKN
ncbi:uncharacterized protein LOC127750902 [Frankliniella occidentalis]|uniref:Uncharacterized protein LOC127750902 n=1 Tax=Frankliniella occidentalis TaxID=133901 RepID=A0A9C6XSK4_FRAOC|nr:uncharacterized protein LOC127750902 [Frankliniella occidentalis]